ncbi:S-adenosyl-L-methionine-dependent methyltransferase [Biscogniauxia sp. FL1348]|nr:S-adenosyl-L-methionine-dependent methyltransferase [Biscogniauxia sp. FL1348]
MAGTNVPKAATADGWTDGSASYEKYLAPMTRLGIEALIEALFKKLPPAADSNFLDCGAGTGISTSLLRQRHPSIPITAVDFAPGMIERVKQLNLPGVKIFLSDAAALDRALVPKAAFTHAVAAHMIQFCGDKQPGVLRELYDSLAPGGVAGISISSNLTIAEPWHRACARLDPGYEPTFMHDDKAWKTPEQLEAAMREAGFEDIQKAQVWMPMCTVASKEDYVDFWYRGNHPAFTTRDMASWKGNPDDVLPELLKVLGEYKDLSYELGFASDIVLGRRPTYSGRK